MATVSNTPKYERAADSIEGIGPAIKETVLGRDIVLRGVSIEERAMRGDTQVFVMIRYTEVGDDEIKSAHAWSPTLGEKLIQLRPTAMNADLPCAFELDKPMLAKFTNVTTGGGFKALTIE